MKILLLGAQGQLGTELLRTNPGHALTSVARSDLDVTQTEALRACFRSTAPEVVLNAVAYNHTDRCEEDPAPAWTLNTLLPRQLARLCREGGARLLHFSTDFVFDGKKGSPYVESDVPSPVHLYGLSKYGGERFVLSVCERNIICRTAALYGPAGSRAQGGNFVQRILSRARRGESLCVVDDVMCSPTSAADLAEKVWELLAKPNAGGIYHLVNEGGASWFEFARAILSLAHCSCPLSPISSSQWSRKNPPLPDTRLVSERLSSLGIGPLRPWREALAAYLQEHESN